MGNEDKFRATQYKLFVGSGDKVISKANCDVEF